ncbi:hypothetical protein RM543_13375 [Roseicyclus sp. F158]|uniref:Flap endonuclease-1-like 5' DNA nuclease n=1 Tax=Tropicimonas omnivorans TaxID=3075590 RepID=A0ABU3DIY6_9RHOB|nr:hypothetical protein [Roseicyclus sp. F158]MDT0683678.1 hypothetical protein [Roseicyclus sp. F158]
MLGSNISPEDERRAIKIGAAGGLFVFLVAWATTGAGFLGGLLIGILAMVAIFFGMLFWGRRWLKTVGDLGVPGVSGGLYGTATSGGAEPLRRDAEPTPEAATEARPDRAPDPVSTSQGSKTSAAAEVRSTPRAVIGSASEEASDEAGAHVAASEPEVAPREAAQSASGKPRTDAAAPEAAPAPAATGGEAGADSKGDASAKAPERLDGPREGGGDDLLRIKGIGPKLKSILHDEGIYHLDQIAGWTPAEVAWVDEHIEAFRGRASRDDWVGQARLLVAEDDASGETTGVDNSSEPGEAKD